MKAAGGKVICMRWLSCYCCRIYRKGRSDQQELLPYTEVNTATCWSTNALVRMFQHNWLVSVFVPFVLADGCTRCAIKNGSTDTERH